ncbi:nucleotidyl transferase AbiEii/AbiGii toxin family protein [Albimonas pacifica]|uniref:Nucleotidyl transferase AbiEii toxin, Type IV TA system n=1 Tax=Albimonas pacifica TaxID=1114924 RepID=A0A1I3DGI5_9RHOB|nr:nucleotidyl transferase AbiEii/AbiGii toxin family protein [Albimonas pacifica]SFH85844.1 Nucleotidyl transferase AbiEii toxin, Type IV TA system [Albimonas pacifica]
MPIEERYRRQVSLLMRILPLVAEERDFALKGGTAINLFHRDLPRLSVDIDLTYLPLHDRPEALAGIDAGMRRIEARILADIPGARAARAEAEGAIRRLTVTAAGARVKVEISPVLRGVVNAPRDMAVSEAVEDAFGFAETQVVSFEDLYAGKLLAALDRQHPRDLFDVRDLLRREGLTDALREAFVVYLISHHRPMGEVLSARPKDISQTFERGFDGMTLEPVTLQDLLDTRRELVAQLVGAMPPAHRTFLLGFERGEPDWTLIATPHARELPAVRWRVRNLETLSVDQREALVGDLAKVLAVRSE